MLIFHHIPKSAGTSLESVVAANYRYDELAWTYKMPRTREWYRLWWSSLPPAVTDRLRCVVGHGTSALIPALDRPFTAFCVVRHPVERALSLRGFMLARQRGRRWWSPGYPRREGAPGLIDRLDWSIHDIYRHGAAHGPDGSPVHPGLDMFFDGQVRLLSAAYPELALPLSRGPSPPDGALDGLLERMARDFVVGVHDRLGASVARFARAFGWRRAFLPRRNVTAGRERTEELAPETRELVLAHNQLDLALYEHYARELDGLGSGGTA